MVEVQIYTELYTINNQPPAKTSHTHQQQYHQSHIHQVKVEDIIKEEVDKTLQMPLKPKDNPTYKQRQALKRLIIHDTIIINKADKGSTIVIQGRDTYTQIGLDYLKDTLTLTYIYLNMDPTTTLIQNINTTHILPKENTQNPMSDRPNVSTCNFITENISRFLDT